jgi:hypothetical protein
MKSINEITIPMNTVPAGSKTYLVKSTHGDWAVHKGDETGWMITHITQLKHMRSRPYRTMKRAQHVADMCAACPHPLEDVDAWRKYLRENDLIGD